MRATTTRTRRSSDRAAIPEVTIMTSDPKAPGPKRLKAMAGVLLVLGLAGCGLNKASIPGLSGPAELGISFQIEARPDVLTANGVSTSAVQVRVFNQNGQPLSGQAIFFAVANDVGQFVDIGTLSNNTAVSNGSGIAQVIYTTPPRTDSTSNREIRIMARPISGDSNGQIYRFVKIELRSAEPRLFPGGAGCAFVIEPGTGVARVNQDVLFQSIAPLDTVRYEWDFGDGDTDDKPQVIHRYSFPGEYSVVHTITLSSGAFSICSRDVAILP